MLVQRCKLNARRVKSDIKLRLHRACMQPVLAKCYMRHGATFQALSHPRLPVTGQVEK